MCLGAVGFSWSLVGLIFLVPFSFSVVFYCNWVAFQKQRGLHDFLRDHRNVPLEHCEPDALPEREAYWIRTLHTLIPHGLNSTYGKPFYPYTTLFFPWAPQLQALLHPLEHHQETLHNVTPFMFGKSWPFSFPGFSRGIFPQLFYLWFSPGGCWAAPS